jgi:secondary thiamine-phosphate synthase enzyme
MLAEDMNMQTFSIHTKARTQFLDITREVQRLVDDFGLKSGIASVFVPHTTAGITINENADPDVTADIGEALERAVPWKANYRHSEGNAAAHVKASMVGSCVQVPVDGGRLRLGTWQAVYFCEFDGPRTRHVWVQCLGL